LYFCWSNILFSRVNENYNAVLSRLMHHLTNDYIRRTSFASSRSTASNICSQLWLIYPLFLKHENFIFARVFSMYENKSSYPASFSQVYFVWRTFAGTSNLLNHITVSFLFLYISIHSIYRISHYHVRHLLFIIFYFYMVLMFRKIDIDPVAVSR
jgi:hypothetical protein